MTLSLDRAWHKIEGKRHLLLFLFAIALYAPTVTYDYTLDDAIVIYDNQFTQQGIKGIPGLFKYDTFRGFFKVEGKDQLVAGGRYRPLTPMMFAIEHTFVGNKPWLSHLINILLYGLLGILFCSWLEAFIFKDIKIPWLGFMVALIFICHPIHTEVVANIKGRDEILCAILGLLGLKYLFNGKSLHAAILIFLALLAKEMALTWIPIAGAYYLIIERRTFLDAFKKCLPLLIGLFIYLIIRILVLGMPTDAPIVMEMMNNPFVKVEAGQYVLFTGMEKTSSILYALGKYLLLLIWPHPLTHDYYPRSLGIVELTDIGVILSGIVHMALITLGLLWIRKRRIISFSIGFYLISLVLISNLIFPIGTHMGERFVFMASMGFLIGIISLIFSSEKRAWALPILIVICIGFTLKTWMRVPAWKNDFTLFTTDVHTSKNSAKALNAAAGSLVDRHIIQDENKRDKENLEQAIGYVDKAIKIHPNYKSAHLIKGNAHYLLEEFESAKIAYENALRIDPQLEDARKNLQLTLTRGGQFFGEEKGDINKAIIWLEQAILIDPSSVETLRLLGVAAGVHNNFPQALSYFRRILEVEPQNPVATKNIGITLIRMGREDEGLQYIKKAEELGEHGE